MKVVVLLFLFVPVFSFAAWCARYQPSDESIGLVLIVGLCIWLPASIVLPRRFARLRIAKPDEKLEYPLQQRSEGG
jgi:hypothetical protein